MAITDKEQGVWGLDQVYNKINQGSIWTYSALDPHSLWAWGDNEEGTLGQNNHTQYSSPVQVGGDSTWSVLLSGGGDNQYESFAIKTDGTLWAWGSNGYGTLGLNNRASYSSPIQIPGTTWAHVTARQSTLAVKTDGTLWSWGEGSAGTLGLNTTIEKSSPTQIPGTTWASDSRLKLWISDNSAWAIKTDGTLWAWGNNAYGQLGQNSQGPSAYRSSPVQVGSDTTWQAVTGGANYVISTKTDGTLWSWGNNDNGYLGLNDIIEYSSPVQIGSGTDWGGLNADVSRYEIGAIKTDGTLWVWGKNTAGSLGQNEAPGGSTYTSSPTQIPGTNWKQLSGGDDGGMIATKTDGTLWGWGANPEGELGLNNTTYYSSPVQIPGTKWTFAKMGRKKVLAFKDPN